MVCVGVSIARTGEMEYGEGETPLETGDSGVVKISRSEDEVFRPETIASFEGKPVTITHPIDFVGPGNWSRLAKGTIQNVRRGVGDQKDDLIADILITDDMAISLVKNGLREVSCGYEAEYTQVEEGKGNQTNIIGNHLALVDQGRAGSNYAINDSKGAKMTIREKIKTIFARAQDEAMKAAEDADKEMPAKDEDKKDEPAKDAGAYDELVKMVKDLGEKVSAMAKPKDEEKPAEKKEEEKPKDEEKSEEKKDESKDDDQVEASMEDRLKAVEAAVQKLLEMKAGDEESEDAEEGEEKAKDEDGEEESEDDDFDESTMVGDTASRAEILAPGIKLTKDVKAKALKAAYETKDGKKVLDALSAGSPDFKTEEKVNTLFLAASEVLKAQRTSELSKTKQTRDFDGSQGVGFMTPEKINEINSKHYQSRN